MNPILNKLNGNAMANIAQIRSLLDGKNPADVMNYMLGSNPQFRQFVSENKGLTTEQIANKYGIDMSVLNKFR